MQVKRRRAGKEAALEEPRIVGECVLCEIPMCSAKVKPPPGAWYERHLGRRLCVQCYGLHRRQGSLEDFDRLTRSRAEVFEEWLLLKRSGVTRREAARRMGMTVEALDQVRYRMAYRMNMSLRSLGPVERINKQD